MRQRPASQTALAALVGVVALGLCIGLVYLLRASRSKPAPFARGEPIIVGSHTVAFQDAEAFTFHGGDQGLAVFFRWEGEGDVGYLQLALFFKSYFSLVDPSGKRYRAATAMSEEAYRRRQEEVRGDSGSARTREDSDRPFAGRRPVPAGWVSVFRVPQESHGFTLRFDHPKPTHGQADRYEAPLGR